jgi:hypothetical protein
MTKPAGLYHLGRIRSAKGDAESNSHRLALDFPKISQT